MGERCDYFWGGGTGSLEGGDRVVGVERRQPKDAETCDGDEKVRDGDEGRRSRSR